MYLSSGNWVLLDSALLFLFIQTEMSSLYCFVTEAWNKGQKQILHTFVVQVLALINVEKVFPSIKSGNVSNIMIFLRQQPGSGANKIDGEAWAKQYKGQSNF